MSYNQLRRYVYPLMLAVLAVGILLAVACSDTEGQHWHDAGYHADHGADVGSTGNAGNGVFDSPPAPPTPITVPAVAQTATSTAPGMVDGQPAGYVSVAQVQDIVDQAVQRIADQIAVNKRQEPLPALIPFQGCQEWSMLAEAPAELGYPGGFFVETLFPVCDGVIGARYDRPIAAYVADLELVNQTHLNLRKLVCDVVDSDNSGQLRAAGFTPTLCALVKEQALLASVPVGAG